VSSTLPPEKKVDRRKEIRGKLKAALNAMVWGIPNKPVVTWDEAARNANLTIQAMRKALEKPHVRQYLQAQKQVLRSALGAKTLSRLDALMMQDDNRAAAVSAAKVLEQGAEENKSPAAGQAPGLVLIVAAPGYHLSASALPTIEHRPADRAHSLPNAYPIKESEPK
jgi:hypothetical protein